ncbi:RecX family transcriptional regulator [Falsarthrobacter nasiphocae]|uniref:Regulatory protein RecX n=1 Tax=Falsarthrobacter nasiphocae TaxID=189863 RepID=A0AAE4C7M0_9MICC|nr:SOS response regulatory protein OraA/RecX [Falsarthrobacter nasiphocae]
MLDRYEDVGLIDDARFARVWVAERSRLKMVGATALREELRRKGVAAAVIEAALAAELPPETEESQGEELARVKARAAVRRIGASALEERAGRDKALRSIVAAVARKGHSPSRAFEWARRALDAELEALR